MRQASASGLGLRLSQHGEPGRADGKDAELQYAGQDMQTAKKVKKSFGVSTVLLLLLFRGGSVLQRLQCPML